MGGKGKFLKGDLYGQEFSSSEECWAAMRERGYLAEFGRNSVSFRMSKRARKGRHIINDPSFVRAVLQNPKVKLPPGTEVREGSLYRGYKRLQNLWTNGKEIFYFGG